MKRFLKHLLEYGVGIIVVPTFLYLLLSFMVYIGNNIESVAMGAWTIFFISISVFLHRSKRNCDTFLGRMAVSGLAIVFLSIGLGFIIFNLIL